MADCKKCSRPLPDGSEYCCWCGARQSGQSAKKYRRRPNGAGSVYKLPGRRRKPWAAVKGGKYLGFFEKRTDALDALEAVRGKKLSQYYNYTFAEVFEAWKVEHYPDIIPRSQYQYDHAFDIFAPLHGRKFRELRTQDFQDVIDSYKEGRSMSSVAKLKQLTSQMSNWAIREELITTNFASFCRVAKTEQKHKVPFTAEEIARIEADGSEAAMIVLMFIATGMRIKELFSLPLEDYHGKYVVGGEKTDAGKNRIIPIRPEGRPYFEYFAKKSAGMDKLLDGYSGNKDPANYRSRDYYPLLDRLGISREKTPHSTRTTYSTRAVKEELSPATLQKVLGHADFNTTQKYYNRPDADTLVESVEKAAQQ